MCPPLHTPNRAVRLSVASLKPRARTLTLPADACRHERPARPTSGKACDWRTAWARASTGRRPPSAEAARRAPRCSKAPARRLAAPPSPSPSPSRRRRCPRRPCRCRAAAAARPPSAAWTTRSRRPRSRSRTRPSSASARRRALSRSARARSTCSPRSSRPTCVARAALPSRRRVGPPPLASRLAVALLRVPRPRSAPSLAPFVRSQSFPRHMLEMMVDAT